jgi:exoribonuclease R
MAGILQTKDYVHFEIRSPKGDCIASFEGTAKAGKAFHGDMVTWNAEKEVCTLQLRTKHYPLVGVLELASKATYGITSRGVPMYLFTPCRKEYPFMVVGCSERELRTNCLVVVDFDTWDTSVLPRGVLRTLLGPCGDPETEKKALLMTFNPYRMPKGLADLPVSPRTTTREPCPPLTFNIDPEGCKDIDDVLSIKETEKTYELWITIADVSETIEPGTPLDDYASLQAFTAYADGKAVKPMLPHEYSEGHCSLLPGSVRPGVSLVLEVDKCSQSTILKQTWKLTEVENKTQYDYDTFIEQAKENAIPVGLLADVASGILGYETHDPHKWIEAFMLHYNKSAAKLLRKVGRGVLRNHTAPNLETLEYYKSFGLDELTILANHAAQYCAADDPTPIHYGLSASVYCHATSPIRRYADLLNQRVLKDILTSKTTYIQSDILWLNQRQKDMKRYERDLFLVSQLQLCKKGTVHAVVVKQAGQKLKLWIPDWKRLLSWTPGVELPDTVHPGSKLLLAYFANPSARQWKEKIVFRLEDLLD